MKHLIKFFSTLSILAICGVSDAQIPGGNQSPINSAMLKLFGKNTNFTAKADVRILDNARKETMSMLFNLALLGGKMRAEMDMAQMKSAMISPQMLTQMKQMGADKTIYIVRPDTKTSYVIYPSLKAYATMPVSDADQQSLAHEPKIQKTALGKETIDGHPCVKNKVVVTDDKGKTQEATVWNATDLKDFAIRMQMQEKDTTLLMTFKNVQFTKPDAKQFEPPAGYTKHQSLQEIQQVMMQKMMQPLAK